MTFFISFTHIHSHSHSHSLTCKLSNYILYLYTRYVRTSLNGTENSCITYRCCIHRLRTHIQTSMNGTLTRTIHHRTYDIPYKCHLHSLNAIAFDISIFIELANDVEKCLEHKHSVFAAGWAFRLISFNFRYRIFFRSLFSIWIL